MDLSPSVLVPGIAKRHLPPCDNLYKISLYTQWRERVQKVLSRLVVLSRAYFVSDAKGV